ncbi:MAG: hypothetical protein U0939_20460 [Pirellulales bacterium]
MLTILKILTEALFRLKDLPGLGFLNPYYCRVRETHDQIKKKIKSFETRKGNLQANLRRVKEIPSLIKGSKKKKT